MTRPNTSIEYIPPFYLISGPTASGKSKFAIEVAKTMDGEIINFDSVQFYKELDIGSAKITQNEMENIPHHNFDLYLPNEEINVAKIRELTLLKIKEVYSRNKLPILVGSSGMYISILFKGIDDLPESSSIKHVGFKSTENDDLWIELNKLDPQRASQIHPNDKYRVERALEICKVLKKEVSGVYTKEKIIKEKLVAQIFVLNPDREDLYSRINKRTSDIIEKGIIQETEKILFNYGNNIKPLKSIGYNETVRYLQGEIKSEEELFAEISKNTRRYAKRQLTFWRNEPVKNSWLIEGELPKKLQSPRNSKRFQDCIEIENYKHHNFDANFNYLKEKNENKKPNNFVKVKFIIPNPGYTI